MAGIKTKRKLGTIQAQMIVAQYEAIKKSRRVAGKMRISWFPAIVAIGAVEGGRLVDVAELMQRKPNDLYNYLCRIIRTGYICKNNRRYYLTDNGRKVYQSFSTEYAIQFDKLRARMKDELLKEIITDRLKN